MHITITLNDIYIYVYVYIYIFLELLGHNIADNSQPHLIKKKRF